MPKLKSNTANHKKATLLILSFVMVVNALAYGIIIPLLYPYAERFGMTPLGLGWLAACFSLAQFIATPIIGRLSDRYGRKPLLLFCLFGTSLSLALFASAQSIIMLFIARILDGITGGNVSVAQAVIADSSSGQERAKNFGILGAAFGFGFLFGPAIGSGLSTFGLTVPFWFASALALVGTILGVFMLKESLPERDKRIVKHEPLFQFHHIAKALFAPQTGIILLISFLASVAINVFIIGFQSFTVDVLALKTQTIGMLFALFGLVSMIMQAVGIKYLLKWFVSKKRILTVSMALSAVVLAFTGMTNALIPFVLVLFWHMVASAPQNPMISALLSERSNEEDQGGVLGINQAYVSLGQIAGPLLGGWVAGMSVPSVFWLAAGLYVVATLATLGLYAPVRQKLNL